MLPRRPLAIVSEKAACAAASNGITYMQHTKLALGSRPAPCTLAVDKRPHRTTICHLPIALGQKGDGCRGLVEACAGSLAFAPSDPLRFAHFLE